MTDPQSPARSPSLTRVARGDLCAGCGACAGVAPAAIRMEQAAPGFLRPRQIAPLSDREERLIAQSCPGLGQTVAAAGRPDPVLWGPVLQMCTGWAGDPALRHAGASGGALSALLTHLLATGLVETVVQIAADPALPVGNITVLSDSTAAIAAAAGSRYAPSAPLAGLADLVAGGRRHAFVGKPCDVAALRALAGADTAVAAAFPVILSFFCAGVPSQSGAEVVLAALGTTLAETATFRYRGNGWPGRATARLKDGTERSMSYPESWGGILSKHAQFRCKICADGTGAAADIVCADAWDCDARGYPVFDEAPGISLIVARTPLGARLIAEAEAAGRIATAPFEMERLAALQPGQRERRRALLARLAALRLLGRPIPRYAGLHLLAAARQNPPVRTLRNFLGMLRRTLRRR